MRGRPLLAYGFSIVAFLVALQGRFVFDDNLPPGYPFVTFFPAVILSSAFAGTGPGILCAVLSLFSAWYWFIPAAGSFGVDSKTLLALGFFTLVSSIDILILDVMHRALAALGREREALARLSRQNEKLARQRENLFQELQHRVANNFQMVASLLSLQSRRLQHVPEAQAMLREARDRIDMMSKVHRRLYQSSTEDVVLARYLEELVAELVRAHGREDIVVTLTADNLPLSVENLTTLSMILLEAVTNAVKHGFTDHPAPRLTVQLTAEGCRASLAIADNGPGYPEGFDPRSGTQLGFRLIDSFALALGGTLHFDGSEGTRVRVEFPLEPALKGEAAV